MSDEQNIEEQPENIKPPPTNDSGETVEGNLFSSEENKIVAEESQSQILNPQPSTSDMEVHHHGHVHENKKWKEYLFQFFMLFLAVFCGFLAEYQLEHKIETDREKQFIQSLVNDINADTARIKVIINQRNIREQRLDSLSFLMNNDTPVVVTNIIYYYAALAARSLAFRFIPNDGTMQQLKNSGAFRLIRKRSVADSIASYDVRVRSFLRHAETEEDLILDYRRAAALIFDALVFDRLLDQDANVRMPNENPRLLDYSKEALHTWNYQMFSMKSLNKGNRRDMKLLFQQAANLLNTLKTEYHLE